MISVPRSRAAADLADLLACEVMLRAGSKSFFAASRVLPPRLRLPAGAIYGFCRVADDAIDEGADPRASLGELQERLDRVYGSDPIDHPVDRALSVVCREYELPKVAFEALLEGFAWDVEGRRYTTLPELRAYCVRVASTVGILMAALMGERRPMVLARACDLGVAMQLTNIARDVGEDAREGRVYLPLEWLEEIGSSATELTDDPSYTPELGGLVRRLLQTAAPLYRRADDGIRQLPRDCRVSIYAASLIYEDIGRVIEDNGYDSFARRAVTGVPAKLARIGLALSAPAWSRGRPTREPTVPEAQFLVDAFLGAGPVVTQPESVPAAMPANRAA